MCLLGVYCPRKALWLKQCDLSSGWTDWDFALSSTPVSTARTEKEWMKTGETCSATTVHLFPLWSLVKQKLALFVCDSAAPSLVPGWNWSSKQMHTLLNESMSDSSNQFNLAYAFLVGVPINYQLPMFTLQCVTIFLLASMNSLGWENWLLKWLPA